MRGCLVAEPPAYNVVRSRGDSPYTLVVHDFLTQITYISLQASLMAILYTHLTTSVNLHDTVAKPVTQTSASL